VIALYIQLNPAQSSSIHTPAPIPPTLTSTNTPTIPTSIPTVVLPTNTPIIPTNTTDLLSLCTVTDFKISPSDHVVPAGTALTLYGLGQCKGGIRSSRFQIDGNGYAENSGLAEQTQTWTLTS